MLARILLSCCVAAGVAACGQKGPLYLPDKAGTVVTRPRAGQPETPPETAPQTPDAAASHPDQSRKPPKKTSLTESPLSPQ